MGSANRPTGSSKLRAVPRETGSNPPPPLSDDALIEAVRLGDDRIADQLYDRVVGVVDRTLYRVFGGRGPEHDDLVQSTFEQLVITLARRRFAGACSLSTWASSIASHVGLNALRVIRRERRILDRDDQSAGYRDHQSRTDVEREVGARLQIACVRGHLAAMDPAKARTVLLHDVIGHDLAEIAVLMGVSVAAVQSRLVRGRRELAGRLAQDQRAGVMDEAAK